MDHEEDQSMAEVKLDKEVFTTFDVAKLCHCNITSVKNWIEKGNIRAFRTPGGHWRIERDVLSAFMDRQAMPNPFNSTGLKRVVVVTSDPALTEKLRRKLGRNVEVIGAYNATEASLFVGDSKPDCLVVDLKLEGLAPMVYLKTIRALPHFNPMQIIAWTESDDLDFEQGARNAGLNDFVRQKEGFEQLSERVSHALA